jgi:uncharacterized Rmd1/YagE family protein
MRYRAPAGYTNEECQKLFEKILIARDLREDRRRERQEKLREEEAYKNSDAYFLTKLQSYKQRELDQLAKSIQEQRRANGNRFMGGYTSQAIHDANFEGERITKLEQDKKADIEKKYDGSKECIEMLRRHVKEDEEKGFFLGSAGVCVCPGSSGVSLPSGSSGPGVPRVGGYAARHAVAHGGGFNHPGVYAGNVFM